MAKRIIKYATLTLYCFFSVSLNQSLAQEKPQSKNAGKAVLVTGASSGSGRLITETLADKGYYVFAGARKQKDLDELNALQNVQAIRLDVTIQSEIDSAVITVKKSGRGLYGLVNNAGVGLMAPLIELAENDLEFIFDVNVYGPYRITKAFAPLLIESKGRVVMIGSIAGFQTRTFYGPYSMSKHALEAFTDALAIELERFEVAVSIVDPGGFSSNIGKNIYARLKSKGLNFDNSLYKQDWENNWVLKGGDLSMIKGPEAIVAKVEDALFDAKPQRRYMVVGDAGRAENTMRALLRRMLELNHDQPFSYDRVGLIELMDDERASIEASRVSEKQSEEN
jgi:NAD(P)-dependent dehydrogenase (short-subunit alcohol dehydrogenase family)